MMLEKGEIPCHWFREAEGDAELGRRQERKRQKERRE